MARAVSREYTPVNRSKYVGAYPIIARSSWEYDFMVYCDHHPQVLEWASEPLQIPYSHPISGKQTIYIPDFLLTLVDTNGQIRKKLIEIKPRHEQLIEHARNTTDAMIQAVNRAKWGAAITWCSRRGIEFDVINEAGLYDGHALKPGRLNPIHQYAPAQTKKKTPKQPKKAKMFNTLGKSRKSSSVKSRSRTVAKARRAATVGKARKI